MEQTFDTFQIIIKDGSSVNLDIRNLQNIYDCIKKMN